MVQQTTRPTARFRVRNQACGEQLAGRAGSDEAPQMVGAGEEGIRLGYRIEAQCAQGHDLEHPEGEEPFRFLEPEGVQVQNQRTHP